MRVLIFTVVPTARRRRRRRLVYLFFVTIVACRVHREVAAFTRTTATTTTIRPVQFVSNPSQRFFSKSSAMFQSSGNDDHDDDNTSNANNHKKKEKQLSNVFHRASIVVTAHPQRSLLFSCGMTLAGATLGPFLDTYHSTFGVLHYDHPITAALWSTSTEHPALITAWWVPELFGLAGFLIGWLYILLDDVFFSDSSTTTTTFQSPSVPKILVGISYFTFQYWFSGVLVAAGVDRVTLLNIMSILAASGFLFLDGTWAGLWTSTATALGGPLIELGLLSLSRAGALGDDGYSYTDLGETGFFPLWICPVYFLGGPANGNLARGLWNAISVRLNVRTTPCDSNSNAVVVECPICQTTRTVPCPNCDGKGDYIAMGGRRITCTSCRGRGFVICRDCFGLYDGDDPYDIDAIREKMSRMPD